ncbi:threonine ammonia-lyase [bacterium]|nr:threonine ammonia-lyase [bacterium]
MRTFVKPTPLVFNQWLSEAFNCEVFLKLESMQSIGSFKIRGATYKILNLSESERKRGVIAASAGNHAQGVAWASRHLGVQATIVMPSDAALVKVHNTQALGAKVVLHGANYDEAYAKAIELAQVNQSFFVSAYEDADVIAGQGTVGLEVLDELNSIDLLISSVGGGGLMTGVGTVFRALSPQTRLVACQAAGAAAMCRSVKAGKTMEVDHVHTFADGIAIKRASEVMRKLLTPVVHDWVEVDDEAIASAVFTLMEKAKVVAEGSAAITLAALESFKTQVQGKRVVLIVSGGNIDVNLLSRIIDLGMIKSGRRVRVNVLISDKPGSLARLTSLIAQQGANVIQAIHDRNEPSTRIDQTEVALTLETKGSDHSRMLIDELSKQVIRLELAH